MTTTATRRGVPAFLLLGAVQAALFQAMMVIAVALPAIQRDLRLDDSELAMVSSAYPVSLCGLLLLGGRLGDVFGARRAFLLGTFVFALGTAASALAGGLPAMLLARFAQGIGAALAAPAGLTLLRTVFTEPARQARALAVWGGLPVLGAAVGLLICGPVISLLSWRWTFLPALLVAVAALLTGRRLLPGVLATGRQRVDVFGAVLVTAGLALVCAGLEIAGEQSWRPELLGMVLAGALLLGLFLVVETRGSDPLLPMALLAAPRRLLVLIGLAAGGTGTFSLSFFLPLYFQQQQGLSALQTSAAYLPYVLAMVASAALSGRLLTRLGVRPVAVLGLSLGACGLLLMSTMDSAVGFGAVLAGMVVFPAGAMLLFSSVTVAALDAVPQRHTGVAGGLVNTALEIGPTVGFAVLVAVAAASSAGVALAVTAGVYLLLALVFTLVLRS